MGTEETGAAYDARAQEYTERFGHVAAIAGADLSFVTRWRDTTAGLLLDAGCGPGHWVGVLGDGGRRVVGLDLSPRFLRTARSRHPTVPFLLGSLGALPLRDGSVGGVLAWYSTIHTAPGQLASLLAEVGRVLRPGGSVLLGVVDGEPGQAFDHAVATAYSWSVAALGTQLGAAGLEVVEHERRHDDGLRPHAALVARRAPVAR